MEREGRDEKARWEVEARLAVLPHDRYSCGHRSSLEWFGALERVRVQITVCRGQTAMIKARDSIKVI